MMRRDLTKGDVRYISVKFMKVKDSVRKAHIVVGLVMHV